MDPIPSHPPVPAAPASTVLRLKGRDALDLLHRITTQSLRDLVPGRASSTLFCDFRGRLLHRATVALCRDGAVWLLRDDAPAGGLSALLDRSVFREDVRVEDLGADWTVRGLPGGAGLPAGTIREADGRIEVAQCGDAFALVVEPAGAGPAGPDEGARIREGRPRHGHEIAVEFNPYEVGLAREIHLGKGCYTGQEALLRLFTYGGVRRRLVGLSGTGAVPSAPADVTLEGRPAGRLTSAAADGEGWIALAALGPHGTEPGARLEVAGRPATLEDRFPPARPMGLP